MAVPEAPVFFGPTQLFIKPQKILEKNMSFLLERFFNGWKMFIQKWIKTGCPSKNSGNEAIRGYDWDAGIFIPYFSGYSEVLQVVTSWRDPFQ